MRRPLPSDVFRWLTEDCLLTVYAREEASQPKPSIGLLRLPHSGQRYQSFYAGFPTSPLKARLLLRYLTKFATRLIASELTFHLGGLSNPSQLWSDWMMHAVRQLFLAQSQPALQLETRQRS